MDHDVPDPGARAALEGTSPSVWALLVSALCASTATVAVVTALGKLVYDITRSELDLGSGVAGAILGASGAIVLGGVGTLVVAGAWWVVFPRLRDVDAFPTGPDPDTRQGGRARDAPVPPPSTTGAPAPSLQPWPSAAAPPRSSSAA